MYIYVWRYLKQNITACHVYVIYAELGHSHFLYVPAVSNVVTNGYGRVTKNVLKGVKYPVFCISSATTVAKVKLFSTWTRSTVSFYSM